MLSGEWRLRLSETSRRSYTLRDSLVRSAVLGHTLPTLPTLPTHKHAEVKCLVDFMKLLWILYCIIRLSVLCMCLVAISAAGKPSQYPLILLKSSYRSNVHAYVYLSMDDTSTKIHCDCTDVCECPHQEGWNICWTAEHGEMQDLSREGQCSLS